MSSNYNGIRDILEDFFNDNIDKQIGELTLNDIIRLADIIDNRINIKKVIKI